MHELAITESILAIVLQKAGEAKAGKVTSVDLLVGRLTGFVPECIEQQFAILSHGTMAQGARLVFRQPLARLHCRKCDMEYSAESFDLKCPGCQSMQVDVLSGSELYVESMEVE